jgi:hypothetical protein
MMISKGKKVVDFVEVYFSDKTQELIALVYVLKGVGEYIRQDGMWLPFEDMPEEIYDGSEYVVLEKADALDMQLKEKFDEGDAISRDEVFAKGTDKYDDI